MRREAIRMQHHDQGTETFGARAYPASGPPHGEGRGGTGFHFGELGFGLNESQVEEGKSGLGSATRETVSYSSARAHLVWARLTKLVYRSKSPIVCTIGAPRFYPAINRRGDFVESSCTHDI